MKICLIMLHSLIELWRICRRAKKNLSHEICLVESVHITFCCVMNTNKKLIRCSMNDKCLCSTQSLLVFLRVFFFVCNPFTFTLPLSPQQFHRILLPLLHLFHVRFLLLRYLFRPLCSLLLLPRFGFLSRL